MSNPTYRNSEKLDTAVQRLTHQLQAEQDKYTEERLVQIIREVLLSGDIVSFQGPGLHRTEGNKITFSTQMAIVYLPYHGVEQLRAENSHYLALLKANNIDPNTELDPAEI